MKNFRAHFLFPLLILLTLSNMGLLIWLNLPKIKTLFQVSPTLSITTSQSATPTATKIIETASPTSELPNPMPGLNLTVNSTDSMIFLSIADGEFFHLFTYSPQNLPLIRLTNNPWDDIEPVLAPSGQALAFSSRRNGYWDLYAINLVTNELNRVTDTPEYEGKSSWSPDSTWLAYEFFNGTTHQIRLKSLADPNAAPVELTQDDFSNRMPAWSPAGRSIALVSSRSGEDDIWLAYLDRVEDRFVNISQNPLSPDKNPAWSPDGRFLTWSATQNGTQSIFLWDSQYPDHKPIFVGEGSEPTWSPDGQAILTTIQLPNQTGIAAYSPYTLAPVFPMTILPGTPHGITWGSSETINLYIQQYGEAIEPRSAATPVPTEIIFPVGRTTLAEITNISAPYPYLQGWLVPSFEELRRQSGSSSGWDFLATLENAYIPITRPASPGISEDWLYTGLAISANPVPLQAGWVVIVREEIQGQTYWRLYLKARYQDGSQGIPLADSIWNMDGRYSGDPVAYENGGDYLPPPSGYWVDFTEIAHRLGWERVPAQINWRTFYAAARFNLFIQSTGLSWSQAMDQMYPPEALDQPTIIPTWTITPSPTNTPRVYRTITITPSPTQTNTPGRRPTWTPMP